MSFKKQQTVELLLTFYCMELTVIQPLAVCLIETNIGMTTVICL